MDQCLRMNQQRAICDRDRRCSETNQSNTRHEKGDTLKAGTHPYRTLHVELGPWCLFFIVNWRQQMWMVRGVEKQTNFQLRPGAPRSYSVEYHYHWKAPVYMGKPWGSSLVWVRHLPPSPVSMAFPYTWLAQPNLTIGAKPAGRKILSVPMSLLPVPPK